MSSFLMIYAIVATLFGLSVVVKSYDFTVCLTRIQLDSSWDDAFYGVNPYAIVYVDDVAQYTTDVLSTSSLTVYYTGSCVQLNEGSVYKVQLYESNSLADDAVCWNSDTIEASVDVGTNANSCADSGGNTNYIDFEVEKNLQTFMVTRSNVEYTGTNTGFYSTNTLSSCKTMCESESACNYLSYGYLLGNSVNTCLFFASLPSETYNANAVSVSYSCTVYYPENVGDGTCQTGTMYNVASCGWDGGDCCMATNAALSNNDDCADPLNQDTPTTTTTSGTLPSGCDVPYPSYLGSGTCSSGSPYNTAECEWDGGDCCMATNPSLSSDVDCLDPLYTTTTSTTATPATTNAASGDLVACQWILDNLSGESFPFSKIGDQSCDATAGSNHYYSYSLNGVSDSTTVNDATCNWEGGDCCMETNPMLLTNDDCLDPLYKTTSTTADATTTSSTTTDGSTVNQQGNSAPGRFVIVSAAFVISVSSLMST